MKEKDKRKAFSQLKAMYNLFDEVADQAELVCQQGCASCCTCNVTLTSLEARYLLNELGQEELGNLRSRIENNFPHKRYIPAITFNTFARLCMEGKDIPDEENDPSWGQCPLLHKNLCTIYEIRPFGCRALLSSVNCKDQGYAEVPPFILTLTNLFMQYVEHLDQKGYFGNFSDMIKFLLSDESYSGTANHLCPNKHPFVYNEPAKVLMVPPEHREKAKPVVEELSSILTL